MKTITLEEAHRILTHCAAVMWRDEYDEDFLTAPQLCPLTDDPTNTWLHLDDSHVNGAEFHCSFAQHNNSQIKIDGLGMTLTDTVGDKLVLTILVPFNLLGIYWRDGLTS